MIDAEHIADFMRLQETEDGTRLEVAVVEWDGPASPTLHWKTYRRWRKPPTTDRLIAAQQKALGNSRFFRICQLCGERNNGGHMHDRTTCHSCAERYLGVVY
jgi:hypothetical protein